MKRYRGTSSRPADPGEFASIFESAEDFPEVAGRSHYDWTLVEGVPLGKFHFSSREDYETDPDVTDEEAQANLDRIDAILDKLYAGAALWPVIVGIDGLVIDGYHRLTAASEFGIERIDVLVPRER